ncbi:lipoate protein ligase C-terminal domain-containing protein [Halorhabdus salina]|uniref:lipoate protein ligase C-terminal domain-containing protein n=1 Tax=Halorhabdus salina TaxID=2750670 RepID=UPI0015EFC243|nr:lipoate protein ligase C-terminal domain-containing protein [Halorhabdus salina]
MTPQASKKVPDGKLVRVDIDVEERIDTVTITGDFFVEPPEARRDLETAIEGHPVDVDRETILAALEAVEATLIGFAASDLADLTMEAL